MNSDVNNSTIPKLNIFQLKNFQSNGYLHIFDDKYFLCQNEKENLNKFQQIFTILQNIRLSSFTQLVWSAFPELFDNSKLSIENIGLKFMLNKNLVDCPDLENSRKFVIENNAEEFFDETEDFLLPLNLKISQNIKINYWALCNNNINRKVFFNDGNMGNEYLISIQPKLDSIIFCFSNKMTRNVFLVLKLF